MSACVCVCRLNHSDGHVARDELGFPLELHMHLHIRAKFKFQLSGSSMLL